MSKTIKELAMLKGRVYVHLANDEIGNQFMRQAEEEGFTFCDGAKPKIREYAEIMAVNHDLTINYVGAVGRMAFGVGAPIGNEQIIRIEYEKWLETEKERL